MKGIIKFFDKLPRIAKLILALPILDIVWAVYRLCRSLQKNNFVGIVLAILMLIACPIIFWLIDITTIIVKGKVLWID